MIALKIYPQLIKKLSSQLKKNILITGTNGKTTTARMLATILEQTNVKLIHNRYGSNLLRGIASTLIKNSSIFAKLPKKHLGLWEVDEAAFPLAVTEVKPQIVLITNLFRDQLDRYGEIDTVASKWQKALRNLPKDSIIILNADDATVASLGKSEPRDHLGRWHPAESRDDSSEVLPIFSSEVVLSEVEGTPRMVEEAKASKTPKEILYFGLSDQKLGTKKPDHASDATVCPYCLANLNYKTCFVGHMGIYSCSKCGQIQPEKDIYLKKAKLLFRERTSSEVCICTPRTVVSGGQTVSFTNSLPGTYNLYNLTAATALATALNIPKESIIKGLTSFTPAFGRVEKIKIGDRILNIFLVKNPTGFNEVIETLTRPGPRQSTLLFERSESVVENFLTRGKTSRSKNKVRHSCKGKKQLTCLIALNDLIADSTDVSWIWDVNFEKLAPRLKKIIVSGIRAPDMALRLKYANHCSVIASKAKQSLSYNHLTIEPNLKRAINKLLTQNQKELYILPTYTAMLETRKILNKMGLVHSSWED